MLNRKVNILQFSFITESASLKWKAESCSLDCICLDELATRAKQMESTRICGECLKEVHAWLCNGCKGILVPFCSNECQIAGKTTRIYVSVGIRNKCRWPNSAHGCCCSWHQETRAGPA
jgi:hypothetical protein